MHAKRGQHGCLPVFYLAQAFPYALHSLQNSFAVCYYNSHEHEELFRV